MKTTATERHDQTRAFLQRIDPKAKFFTVQTFDDSEAKRGALVTIVHIAPTDSALDALATLNDQGGGIFFAVNKTDGKGRQTRNIVRVRAVFIDLDGSPLAPVLQAGLDPHCIVTSSPGRWHCYWLVDDCPLDQFKRVQLALARRFNSDRNVHDLPRVLRLPGFLHRKGKPFLSRVIDAGFHGPPYALAEIVNALNLDLDAKDNPLRTVANAAGKITGRPATALESNLQSEPMNPAEFSAAKIIANCQQFAWAQANQADVEEPLWWAMVGTLYRTDDPEIIHQFSSQFRRYTAEETDRKAKHWTRGGVSCEYVENQRPRGCVGCPHKGKIKSPSALGFIGRALVVAAPNTGQLVNSTPLPIDKMIDVTAFPYAEWRSKRLVPIRHEDNMAHLLTAYGFTVSYNVITKDAEEHHPTMKIAGDNAKDVFLSRVTSLCAQNGMRSDGMELHISAIAQLNERNPVVRYLERLQWDGTSRVDALVSTLNVPASHAAAAKIALHRMLIQACAAADAGARGMAANPVAKPKFEYVLILVGTQGAKKSSFMHDVVPRDLRQYVRESTTVNAKDRDSIKQAISYWICELGEIDVTFTRSGSSAMKAFLSQYHDVIRLPYGRTTSKFARRTMFMGSVNEFDFLRDRTGNRRYMPIVARSTLNWSDVEIDQLWAEAWQQYIKGVQWWPTDVEADVLATVAEAHLEKTAIEEKLNLLFDWQGAQTVAVPGRLSTVELWELCFENSRPNMPEMKATADAARRLWRANGSTVVNGEDCAPRAGGTPIRVYRDKGKSCGFVMPSRR